MNSSASIDRHHTDILIVGSGGAGLFAALHAHNSAPFGTDITIAAKGLVGKSGCTRMVQGGYNAALGKGDSVERHFMDTIQGGKWLPNQKLAWKLCNLAVTRIHELESEMGCFFDRNPDGSIHQKPFAGQTADRTVHKGDLTGIEIINRLMEQVLRRPIKTLNEHRAIALIPEKGGTAIAGVLFIDIRSGEFRLVTAKTVLLCTGGGPTMYKYNTPSGDKSMDGLAMAIRAGVSLRDMEMVQFHPTGLLAGPHTLMTGTVLEEGLRGSGGYLLNRNGRRFLFDYDVQGERATRDIVSRAMFEEMSKSGVNRGSGIFISMGHLGPEFVRNKFAGMVKRCADCGFDLAGGEVEVVPTAHYLMGGVVVDADTRTEIEGLFVAGEDAGGVHGSNRLGGNGVANSTVYGGVAGDVMGREVQRLSAGREPDDSVLDLEIGRTLRPFDKRPAGLHELGNQLKQEMWDRVGVIRTGKGLGQGIEKISQLRAELMQTGVSSTDRAFNLTWHEWLDLKSLLEISEVIARSGLARENSRGAHYRSDFPDEGDLENSEFVVARKPGKDLTIVTEPVQFTIVRPGKTILAKDEPETLVKVKP